MSADAKFLLRPNSGGDEVELTGEVLVGRKEDCDLIITEGHPSRHHARLRVEGDGVFVADLGSANGTFVNGEKVDSERQISPGDVVAFDAAKYTLVAPGAAPDTDATVVMSREQLDATVIRSPEELEKELAALRAEQDKPADPPPAPKAAEPKAAEPADAGGSVRPGSWADPSNKAGGAGTQVFTPDQLKAMLEDAGGPAEVADSPLDTPHLQVLSGEQAGSMIGLEVGQGATEWTVGSDADRDIVLKGEGVSGFHAKIAYDGGRWRLVDQMSANGSFVNGNKVVTAYLSPKDRIKLGAVECVIGFSGGAAGGGSSKSGGASGGQKSGLMMGVGAFVGVLVLLGIAYVLFG